MATATGAGVTGNPLIDTLLEGSRWTSPTITYGFPTAGSNWSGYGSAGEPFNGFAGLTTAQQAAVGAALRAWADVAALTFVPVADPPSVATLRFAGTAATGTAHAYLPSTSTLGGDVWFGPRLTGVAEWTPGRFEYMTALHETGHALGLKHPHEAGDISGPADLAVDSVEFTVMSYRSFVGASVSEAMRVAAGSFPTGPMVHDVAAIQALYGPNYATAADDTVYRFTPDTPVIFTTVWDGGGSDTYDLSAYAGAVTVNLEPGAWSTFATGQLARLDAGNATVVARGNVVTAYLHGNDDRALIENAVGGAGGDRLTGNRAANTLSGNGGADTLSGGGGPDILYGNTGDDVLYGNTGDDTLFGGQDRDALFGGQDSDRLFGQLGDDVLYGQLGADVLFGGQGNDTLFGGQGDDALFGNVGDDLLFGNLGNDTMTGGGGADRFVALGNDTITDFNVAEGDRIIAAAGAVRGVSEAGGAAVINLGNGTTVTLAGVPAAAVTGDFFVAA
ncbi:M10 family metallopeptidase [Azospirillum halopraeferens]|uniref:M10 family metallopeptidase n=1 Tax=Azospirillum halopraeferens TaxID=34010 RepID=UPI000429ED9C|nr:M10 family metallopeptidase [Azospirillum halopraeferens]